MRRLGNLVTPHQLLAVLPAKVMRRHKQTGGKGATGKFTASRTMAILKYTQITADRIANLATQATAFYLIVRHTSPTLSYIKGHGNKTLTTQRP